MRREYELCAALVLFRIVKGIHNLADKQRMKAAIKFIDHQHFAVLQDVQDWSGEREKLLRALGFVRVLELCGGLACTMLENWKKKLLPSA